jgi:hypothetical protein
MAFYGLYRQSTMPQKPIPESTQGRRSFRRAVRKRRDGALLP